MEKLRKRKSDKDRKEGGENVPGMWVGNPTWSFCGFLIEML